MRTIIAFPSSTSLYFPDFLYVDEETEMNRLLIGVVSLVLTGMAISASANLLTNSDFEPSTDPLNNWTIAQGSVSVGNVSSGPFGTLGGMNGSYALLGYTDTTENNSQLYQTFNVNGIDKLLISFDWAYKYSFGSDYISGRDAFQTFIRQDSNGYGITSVQDWFTNKDYSNHLVFGHYSGIIDISGYNKDNFRIVFRERDGVTGIDAYTAIDNVVIEAAPVPEPATMLLFGTGLVGLAAAIKRKK